MAPRDAHYVTIDDDGWFIEHSWKCRLEGTIGTCEYNTAIRGISEYELSTLLGRFLITFDNDGEAVLVPTGRAMTMEMPYKNARHDYPSTFCLAPGIHMSQDQYDIMCDEIDALRAVVRLDGEQAEGPDTSA